MGKFFGRHVTHEVAVNELVCGAGKLGVRETYDTYFFGIRISSGNENTRCFGGVASPTNGNEDNGLLDLNSSNSKVEMLAKKRYRIKRSKTTKWYHWSCTSGSGAYGIEPSRKQARQAARKACSSIEPVVNEIEVTELAAVFQIKTEL